MNPDTETLFNFKRKNAGFRQSFDPKTKQVCPTLNQIAKVANF